MLPHSRENWTRRQCDLVYCHLETHTLDDINPPAVLSMSTHCLEDQGKGVRELQ